jgi:membrane fusion protein, hemolysin D
MKSGRAVTVPGARDVRGRDELAFLPAALEIVETPPSPIGRAIAFTLIAIFCLAIAWATFGKVDIVATATGKIVPSGRTKIVQPFEIGVVRAIHVQDGSRVQKGQVLIELDPTISDADRQRQQSELVAEELDVARLKAALAPGDDPLAVFVPPADAPEALVASERQLLESQDAEQRAKLAALDRQGAEKEAERQSYAAAIAKLEATIPIVQQRVDIRKYLADKEYGSKITYLETLSDLVQQQKDLPVEESHLNQAEAALQAIAATRAQTVSEYRRTRSGELVAAEQKVAALAQDLIKAKERTRLQLLTAPVDGTVQQLAVHTVGGVVTPAQPLLEVVPDDSKIEIEAMVSNRDVGFVHAGQEAAVKVDTFNFTKYGLVAAEVADIGNDAVEDPRLGWVFRMRLQLERDRMVVEGREVALGPGMVVTAEIMTGRRRMIEFFLSPLLRYGHESIRER